MDSRAKVEARGKSLYVGGRKFCVRGVTYGPFPPDASGSPFPLPAVVQRDFAAMVENGINSVRTYTVPPRWLLDTAFEYGLRVMVGVPWEQHVAFLNHRRVANRIAQRIAEGVRACAGHPAVLCYAIGNEIPASIVRWYGHRRVERFLERLYYAAKREDPDTLVTYVSYPSTEYLHPSFVDFSCFNVYLEDRDQLAVYLARLQNIAGDRPLVMAEIGLDSMRNGEDRQASVLDWQVRTAFESGCAGAFVFSWCDRWHRGGHEIFDWSFGLTDRERRPKPALDAVRQAFAAPLQPLDGEWPSMTVVVCSYNGGPTIRECLDGVSRLDYPNYEVVVVDDGSTDDTAAIAREFDVRLISVPNGGLSQARNIGLRLARGAIVAYLDDDAHPDPDWLSFLAMTFLRTSHAGVGGPNIAPHGDGEVADCVANSPGGPIHVLHTDLEAEHIPGCNMAFRREALEAVGGFDTRFRIAGDDVDLCWQLLRAGDTLGFSAGAVVWHHRRNSIRAYLRQQYNYGKAEGYLERKWPENYNRLGHLSWSGRLYGSGYTLSPSPRAGRIRYGVWGTGLFQCMYANDGGALWSFTLMPEWYLVTLALVGFALLGLSWAPLLWAIPLALLAMALPLAQRFGSVRRSRFNSQRSRTGRLRLYALTAVLHMLQPLARLMGRMRSKLTPWRRHGAEGLAAPYPRSFAHWSESWRGTDEWLQSLESGLQAHRVPTRRGGEYDRWDLQAAGGLWGSTRLIAALEEHGDGKQFIRVRAWPIPCRTTLVLFPVFAALGVGAGIDAAWAAAVALGLMAIGVLLRSLRECATAMNAVRLATIELPERAAS